MTTDTSVETAPTSNPFAVDCDSVGVPFIPAQEVIIRFRPNGKKEASVQTKLSATGKGMLVLHYEIVAPEKAECLIYNDKFEFIPDASNQPTKVNRVISDQTNTEWWVLGLDSTGKHVKKLLQLLGLPATRSQDASILADGRLEGRAFKVRYGSKMEAVKDKTTKEPTGETKVRAQIYAIIDVATEHNKIAAAE